MKTYEEYLKEFIETGENMITYKEYVEKFESDDEWSVSFVRKFCQVIEDIWKNAFTDKDFINKIEEVYKYKVKININCLGNDIRSFKISEFNKNKEDVKFTISRIFNDYNYEKSQEEEKVIIDFIVEYKDDEVRVDALALSGLPMTQIDSRGIVGFINSHERIGEDEYEIYRYKL